MNYLTILSIKLVALLSNKKGCFVFFSNGKLIKQASLVSMCGYLQTDHECYTQLGLAF